MKRFFTRNYWLFRREQFIRWLAREYLEQENQRFLRYRPFDCPNCFDVQKILPS